MTKIIAYFQSLYDTVQSKDDNVEALIGECEDRASKLQRDFHALCKEHRLVSLYDCLILTNFHWSHVLKLVMLFYPDYLWGRGCLFLFSVLLSYHSYCPITCIAIPSEILKLERKDGVNESFIAWKRRDDMSSRLAIWMSRRNDLYIKQVSSQPSSRELQSIRLYYMILWILTVYY